ETARQLDEASETLQKLAGEDIDTVEVTSRSSEEAPFFARIVSKLSPMVGNLMEQRIVTMLHESASDGHSWHRQDPGFPDAVLVRDKDHEILAGYEIKAWYVLSTEITGRFRESLNLLKGKNVNVVIVAWCMSHMIFGKPHILGVLTVSGEEVASSRDLHYHQPPTYLTIEPNDTSERTANLQQSNVNGYRLQEERSDPELLVTARAKQYTAAEPHTPEAQAEADELMATLQYRLDNNYAKMKRIKNSEIEAFKKKINSSKYISKSITEWKRIFKDLDSDDTLRRRSAERIIEELYEEMKQTTPKTAVAEESPSAH